MRRSDRQVNDVDDIFKIIDRCDVLHLAMVDGNNLPYVVALNFGYEREGDDLILYVHSAKEGKKIDLLKQNPNVYFEMDCGHEFVPGTTEKPCQAGYRYDSVMGSGVARFLDDFEEKSHALNTLMQHVGRTNEVYHFPEEVVARTCVFSIRCKDFTGKHRA